MENIYQKLIFLIKEKNQFKGLPDNFVLEEIERYLTRKQINLSKLSNKDLKFLSKEIRSFLRKYTGRFEKSSSKRERLLEKNSKKELLETHLSTSERKDYYIKLKKIIYSFKPKSILDIGCGLNPIAIAKKNIFYNACDINEFDLNTIRNYFSKNKIKSNIFIYDVLKFNNDLPEADICLIFKVLDFLDKYPHDLTKRILKFVKCKTFIISFATRKISGKRMNRPERKWFEEILELQNLEYKRIEIDNEIFYIIKK
jgi:hypothetical protein